MTIDCERCGETYDPDREPTVPGADTARCPACGAKPDGRDDEDPDDDEAASVAREARDAGESAFVCGRCDERLPDGDAYVDHISDAHDLVAGAVEATGEAGAEDVAVDVEVTVTRE